MPINEKKLYHKTKVLMDLPLWSAFGFDVWLDQKRLRTPYHSPASRIRMGVLQCVTVNVSSDSPNGNRPCRTPHTKKEKRKNKTDYG